MSQVSFDELYASFAAREARFDGLWWVGVKTTGIYCRPMCPSRTPLAKNVLFYPSTAEARAAGFRACKRCKPDTMADTIPSELQALHAEVSGATARRITDWELSQRGLDPVVVRRGFQKHYGATFHQLQRSQRIAHALDAMRNGAGAAEAGLEAGYESSGAFRQRFQDFLGVAPKHANTLAEARLHWIQTPLGPMIAIAVDGALALLEFADRKSIEGQLSTFRQHFQRPVIVATHPVLDQTERELGLYFEGRLTKFTIPIVLPGTSFQQTVWGELQKIPYGGKRSYSELGDIIGSPQAARAVGKANGDNRIAIVVPCHRVVRADGHLCGYAGGLWRKKWLLQMECGEPPSLF